MSLQNIYSPDFFCFSLLSNEWVTLCTIGDEGEDPILNTVNFRQEGQERRPLEEVRHVVKYTYPAFDGVVSTFVDMIEIRADWRRGTSVPTAPFFEGADDHILAIYLMLQTPSTEHTPAVHFVSRSHILRLSEIASRSATPVVVPWESWGSGGGSGTRLIVTFSMPSEVWVHHVHGEKYAFTVPDIQLRSQESGLSVVLLDFKQKALARGAEKPCDLEALGLIPDQDVIGGFFGEEVTTSLSYRSSILHLKDAHGHCYVLCSEDNIIIVDVSFL